MTNYNAGLLEELSAIQPELLLASADSVQAIGANKLCAALLNRADSISYLQRQNVSISTNLHRLKGAGTEETLRNCLQNEDASAASIELATTIAESCKYAELAPVLAARVLDTSLELQQRVDAAYAVGRLENEEAKGRLKALLPITPSQDPQDDLRGTVLRACWPTHLTPDELTHHLTKPQGSSYIGSYNYFLNYKLPKSIASSLDENNAVVLLKWALPYINDNDPFDALGRVACTIYTLCWKWSAIPAIVKLLAEGYLNALSEHQSPFLQKRYEYDCAHSLIFTREAFLSDVNPRMAVLEVILQHPKVTDLRHIAYHDYPLYTRDDLPFLFNRAITNPTGSLAESWAICINAVIVGTVLDVYANQIDQLHQLRPDLIETSQYIREDWETSAKDFDDMKQERKKRAEDTKAEHANNQQRIDREIKQALQARDLQPESFVSLSCWLNSKNGMREIMPIDIRLSYGWAKLTEEEQSVMVNLAERYLKQANIKPTLPDQAQYGVACALTLLRQRSPGTFASLSRDVWHKCSVELLKAAMDGTMDLLAPLFDTLSEQFPDVATEALLNVLSQEMPRGSIFVIRNWGDRLSDSQAKAMLDIAAAPNIDSNHRFMIVDELAKVGKKDLVRAHLDDLFSDGWGVPPTPGFHKLRQLAFVLSPASYIQQLLDALTKNPAWGREWIETVYGRYDGELLGGFLSCSTGEIADIYVWVHTEYPTETRPEHESAYAPGPLDEIHYIKSCLINHLRQSGRGGSTAALETILERLPGDIWLRDCILEARSAEQENATLGLSIAKIEELCKQKTASRCLVNSIQEFLDLIIKTVEVYGSHLQNDTPAISDLWNIFNQTARPCSEEELSDHLKRFLDRSLPSVIINREAQLRRKLFKGGTSGSRTDLRVQATDENGAILTLCIEVKCNWNPSAKTALKEQLIDKYISGGTATAGILLLGWFECNSWDSDDHRLRSSTATWKNADAAKADLLEQACEEKKNGSLVSVSVLDCALR